jgi:hypothetical protein
MEIQNENLKNSASDMYRIYFIGSGWNKSDFMVIVYCLGCNDACVLLCRELFNNVALQAGGFKRLMWILEERL